MHVTEPVPPSALPVCHDQQHLIREQLKRAFDAWPYLFMTVSVIGLIYIGFNSVR